MAEVKESFLAKIPGLNLIDSLRRATIEWIWSGGDVPKITSDNIIKAAFVFGIALVLMSATIGNFVYGILAPIVGQAVALLITFALVGYSTLWFIDPNMDQPELADQTTAVIALLGWFVGGLFLWAASPVIKPLADFFAGLAGGKPIISSMIESFLTTSSVVVGSQTQQITVTLIPIFGTFLYAFAITGLGRILAWLIFEIKAIFA